MKVPRMVASSVAMMPMMIELAIALVSDGYSNSLGPHHLSVNPTQV